MKLLPEMLAEWVRSDLTPEQIGDLLTMTGFELEEIIEVEGEPVLDVNIMANRGDGASVLGLAREVNAKQGGSTELCDGFHGSCGETAAPTTFEVLSPLCDVFATLAIEDVQNGPSPDWLQRRLIRMGQRPRSLLVDLTNYVMLEVGQPLHAYDTDRLTGKIVVREAQAGEKVKTLDEIERELKGGELLITDGSGPIGLAGIMGGASTEVHEGTKGTLIEAAHFNSQSVRATRKAQGMFTEASYRFERSVDPALPQPALERFRQLYQQITGKSVSAPIELAMDWDDAPESPLTLRASRAAKLLGYPLDRNRCASILSALGCEVEELQDPDVLSVYPPSWRFDLLNETDLVEEVGRLQGYEHIPAVLPQGTTQPGGRQGYEAWRQRVLEAAVAEGFQQIVGHSLVAEDPLGLTGGIIGPRVPSSPEHKYLRSSLWTSLGMSARRNGGGVHQFEIGKTFYGIVENEELSFAKEQDTFAILSEGPLNPPGLKSAGVDRADFFTVKGALGRILKSAGLTVEFVRSEDQRLHPTRQADLLTVEGLRYTLQGGIQESSEEWRFGILGQIHPDIAQASGLSPETILASVDLKAAYQAVGERPTFQRFARTPSIRRDLAIVADRELPFANLEEAIRAAAGELLERLWVFDLYEGPNVGEGKKSVGVAIELRKPGATFTDEEANQVRDAIAAGLAPLGATLRV